jgi:hypothetical protein
MRKVDKLINIKKANILSEQRYLVNKNLIGENYDMSVDIDDFSKSSVKKMMVEINRHMPINEIKKLKKSIGVFYGLNESEEMTDDQIENLMITVANELKAAGKIKATATDIDINKLKTGDESGIVIKESKSIITEGFVLGLILASPTLLKLLSEGIDKIYRFFALSDEEKKIFNQQKAAFDYAKKTGKTIDGKPVTEKDIHHMEAALFKTKVGKYLNKASHFLHDVFVGPVRFILAGMDWHQNVWQGKTWAKAWDEAKKPANIIFSIIMIGVAGYFALTSIQAITGLSISILKPIASIVIDAVKGGDMSLTLIKSILGDVHI